MTADERFRRHGQRPSCRWLHQEVPGVVRRSAAERSPLVIECADPGSKGLLRPSAGTRELRSRSVVLVDGAPEDAPAFNAAGNDRDIWRVAGDRNGEAEATVRPLLVVMMHVRAQDAFCVAATDEQEVVETLASYRSHPAFGVRVGPRGPHWGADDRDALGSEDLVEAAYEFGVAITDQEPEGSTLFCEVAHQVPGDLGDPGAARVLRHAEDVNSPGGQFDHEQDVEPLEEDGVHAQEVRGQDAGRLCSQEFSPRGSTSRSRPEAMAAQDTADRGGRDPDTKLSQLTLDAHAPPAPVLRAEPDDKGDNVGIKRRTTRTALLPPSPPLALACLPVPAQQGLGGDEERLPPGPGQQSAQGSEQAAIGRPVPQTFMELAFEDLHLMAEHQDLDVLVPSGASCHHQVEDPTQPEVEK